MSTLASWSSTWSPGFVETTQKATVCSSMMGCRPTHQKVPRSGWPPTCPISGPRTLVLRPAPTLILSTFPSEAFSRTRPVRHLTQVWRLWRPPLSKAGGRCARSTCQDLQVLLDPAQEGGRGWGLHIWKIANQNKLINNCYFTNFALKCVHGVDLGEFLLSWGFVSFWLVYNIVKMS